MGWLSRFFAKPSPADHARALGKIHHDRQRARIIATANAMRADMGLPLIPNRYGD
jgi:hypothetical protein